MILQCDAHLTCLKDCPARYQTKLSKNSPWIFHDRGSCAHDEHTHGTYIESTIRVISNSQSVVGKNKQIEILLKALSKIDDYLEYRYKNETPLAIKTKIMGYIDETTENLKLEEKNENN